MALSQKALDRQLIVKDWIRNQIRSPGFAVYQYDEPRGTLSAARMWMIGGLALSKEYGNPAQHVFENDEYWKIVERELKIKESVFYEHLDVNETAWRSVINHRTRSMATHFYKSAITRGAIGGLILPELVEAFPTFTPPSIAIGTTDGIFPKHAVLTWLGYIGGMANHEGGELGLSNDVTWQSLKLVFSDRTHNIDPRSTGPGYTIRHAGDNASDVEVICVPTHNYARVEYGAPLRFEIGEPNEETSFTIIAEDDTEQIYTLEIVDV